jgi:glycolate oxidase iron-sulfur subunit
MADELLQRKLRHIRSTGAEVVATANPGCLLQLINGAKQQRMNLRVVHPVTLLAEAYRSELETIAIHTEPQMKHR